MQGTVWAKARRQETEFGESWDWPGWSSPAREPGRQLGFGAEGGGLELEWKGDSAPSGWHTLSLLSGAGPESWVPQLALGSETLTLGLQADRVLWAAGCPPPRRTEPLQPPGWTEAHTGGRGLPSSACLETKQTLLSCPAAPSILLRTWPVWSVTQGRSGEEIGLSKGWLGAAAGRGTPEPPDAEVRRASLAGSPASPPATDCGGGEARRHAPLPALPSFVPADRSASRPIPGTKHLCSPGWSHIWDWLPARWGSRQRPEGPEQPGRAVEARKPMADPLDVWPRAGLSFLICVPGLPRMSGVRGSVHSQGWEPGTPWPGGCRVSSL